MTAIIAQTGQDMMTVVKNGREKMTENEAVKYIQIEKECINRDCDRNCAKCDIVQEVDDLNSAYDAAIKALEEVQQYQAIGEVSTCRDAVDIRNKGKVLHARHEFIQIWVVRQKGRHLLCGHRLARDVVAVYFDSALRKIQNTCRTAQRCGFARAVVADKAHNMPRGHLKAQIFHGALSAGVCFGKMADVQHKYFPLFLSGAALWVQPHAGIII